MFRVSLYCLIFALSACVTAPVPPVHTNVDKKYNELESFSFELTSEELAYKKVPLYQVPEIPKLEEGLDGCGKESQSLVAETLIELDRVPVQTDKGLQVLPLADQDHLYYRTINPDSTSDHQPEQEVEYWRRPVNEEEEDNKVALFTLNDIIACQRGIEVKRMYADLIYSLIEQIQGQIKLRNLDREKSQILYASLKKEKNLEILKGGITIEILAADLVYAEAMNVYLQKLRDRDALLFKVGSIVGIVVIGTGVVTAFAAGL